MVVIADGGVRTLKELGRRRVYRAEDGAHGKGAGRHGRRGRSSLLCVPVGTQVRMTGEGDVLVDLDAVGQSAVVAVGGRGGKGNAWFARADYQAPRIAQRGQPGVAVQVDLELKLLADVGIVGLPNVGKSTLLGVISAARPRVGDYAFTTLEPVLGVVDVGSCRFVVADMPGLIEDAHRGAGLGLEFLRHVERTKVLVHLLDGTRPDPVADMTLVNEELSQYSAALGGRRQVVIVNKVDLPEVRRQVEELRYALADRGVDAEFISAMEGTGVSDLMRRIANVLSIERRDVTRDVPVTLQPKPVSRRFEVHREGDAFRVEGELVVTFAEMMPVDIEEGKQELWWRLGRWGVSRALQRAGARPGACVRLGEVELEWPG